MNNLLSNCKRSILFLSLVISTCQLTAQNIWPGDVNQNGIVNQVDLLYVGWAYDAEGEPRAIQGTDWEAYPVPPIEWPNQFPDGSSFYYADANGDGTVNDTDIDVITTLNYSQTNSIPGPEGYLNAPPGSQHPALYLDVISTEVLLGEPIQIDLYLGDADIPVDDFHGIALDINYDSEYNSTFSSVAYNEDPTSWVQPSSEYFDFVYHEDGEKNVDLALSRLSGSTINGYGKLGSFIVIVEDIVLITDSDTIDFTIDNVKFVGADFETFPVIPASTQFVVRRPDCDINTDYEQHSCSSFTFAEENDIELQWTINGQFYQSGSAIDFDTSESGTYVICGFYETVDCPEGPFTCDTIIVSEDCFDDCEFNVEINEESCASYFLFTTGQELVDWYVDDIFQFTGAGYDFHPNAPGIYEICVVNEGCPPATNICETFVITEDCFDCVINIDYEQHSCSSFTFFEENGTVLHWTVNGQNTGPAAGSPAIDFDANESGTYVICGFYETVDCPQGASACDTIIVSEDCFDDCEFNVEINEESCASYFLFTTGQELVDWYVDDIFQFTGAGYDFHPNAPGVYEICVVNEGCPPVTNICETFVISEDCFDCIINIDYEQHSCSSFTFFEENGTVLHWTVNGQNTGPAAGSPAIDFDANESGTYVICGFYETVDCPQGASACDTVVVTEDCFNDCNIEITYEEHSCDSYTFSEMNEQELFWTINGEYVSTFTGIDFDPTTAGTYVICGGIEAPECPLGVIECDTLTIPEDCFEIMSTAVNLENQAITVLPTITNDQFLIDGLLEVYNIKIISANGTVCEVLTTTRTSLTYDVTSLSNGLYFILISNNENQHVKLEKIMKF